MNCWPPFKKLWIGVFEKNSHSGAISCHPLNIQVNLPKELFMPLSLSAEYQTTSTVEKENLGSWVCWELPIYSVLLVTKRGGGARLVLTGYKSRDNERLLCYGLPKASSRTSHYNICARNKFKEEREDCKNSVARTPPPPNHWLSLYLVIRVNRHHLETWFSEIATFWPILHESVESSFSVHNSNNLDP